MVTNLSAVKDYCTFWRWNLETIHPDAKMTTGITIADFCKVWKRHAKNTTSNSDFMVIQLTIIVPKRWYHGNSVINQLSMIMPKWWFHGDLIYHPITLRWRFHHDESCALCQQIEPFQEWCHYYWWFKNPAEKHQWNMDKTSMMANTSLINVKISELSSNISWLAGFQKKKSTPISGSCLNTIRVDVRTIIGGPFIKMTSLIDHCEPGSFGMPQIFSITPGLS